MNKEELLDIYKTLRRDKGKVPSAREFLRDTRATRREIVRKFRTYNELVKAAGDEPRKSHFGKYYTNEEYLDIYGGFIRRFKEVPFQSSWEFHGYKPLPRSYRERFHVCWREMPRLFHSYAKDKPEWNDVTTLMEENKLFYSPGTAVSGIIPEAPPRNNAIEPGLRNSIPGGFHDFIMLSYNSGSALEFERKCTQALSMLGFETVMLGQGKGRNPDGIAEDAVNRYAIIFDAKSRRERYTPGTDDRQVCEYIRSKRKALMARGIEVIYYLIISSEFGVISPDWTFRVQSETGTAVSFITAENLLKLLAKKIGDPRGMDTGLMKRLFVRGGEISEGSIEDV
jgi:hypothetical protein